MAVIAIGDCTVKTISAMAGVNLISVTTPATADAGDTVDVSTVAGPTIYDVNIKGVTDGYLFGPVCTNAGVVTITAGGTDDEARTIYVLCAGAGGV